MPRFDKNTPKPTRSKTLVPVVLMQKYRGFNDGETHGFKPALAARLVTSGAARFFDKEAKQMALAAGFVAAAKTANVSELEMVARSEEQVAELVASHELEMEKIRADIQAVAKTNEELGVAMEEIHKAAETEIATLTKGMESKDEEIAALKAKLEAAEKGKGKAKGGK